MQPPPMNPGPPQYNQGPPMYGLPPKKGMGCWAWGAIIVFGLLIFCGGGLAILGRAAMNSPEFRKGFEEGMNKSRSNAPSPSPSPSPDR